MNIPESERDIVSYASYKKKMFHTKLEKLRRLINSVDDLSLKPNDKITLKQLMVSKARESV